MQQIRLRFFLSFFENKYTGTREKKERSENARRKRVVACVAQVYLCVRRQLLIPVNN